jgi:hypothetical protein
VRHAVPVSESPHGLAASLWASLGGEPGALQALAFTGPARVLPSVYDVTAYAGAAVGVACLAVSDLAGARSGAPLAPVSVDTTHAAAAFLCERLVAPLGWELPPPWDPVAGDYRAGDGWIRLHTNYERHRSAALDTLGVRPEPSAVARAVARWPAETLQDAVVEAGGCAAAMHDRAGWAAHPHGRHAVREPAVAVTTAGRAPLADPPGRPAGGEGPLAGFRVLDLTRVIAGPVCTRFLAAYGAEVLRIDPPGFREVPALLPEVTAGKRRAWLDLAAEPGRRTFETLLGEAHVLVHGLRPGALAGLGWDSGRLLRLNPALIVATLDAYGWAGPWAARRGFDSLVQMSCGIAAEGAHRTGAGRPVPLPAQALDHATGHLLAAGVCEGLARRLRDGTVTGVRASLVGAANLLMPLVDPDPGAGLPEWPASIFETAPTAWGAVRRVRCPGAIAGLRPTWAAPAGPLGGDAPSWGDGPGR